ncbi:major facilitator superfamily domain-containing protein [Podospora didyma]|uniref:Major facilitator superfamily domain-containing protein n=1 Tax=Podospora didyma TaxID=330526 RepID=A0AAE0U0A6_9PEZI|nr:major facilitator superfamily domain-containing protein [Podospora didyma]
MAGSVSAPSRRAEPKPVVPQNDDGKVHVAPPEAFQHSWRVWCIFIVLCLLSFISAVDATIITTSLPTITREIGGGHDYVWIANSFLFSSTVPQPFFGQIANIFGRRNPMIVSIFLFALGSGIAGGATGPAMLIAARAVQGLGTGGLYVLSDIIICDIIPPRHRGPYLSAVLSTAAIGTTIGPIIGGALALVNWRWVFWLNLPFSGVGLVAIVGLLNVKYERSPTWLHALARVDFLGNAIFIPSMAAIFFGLIMGGTQGYPWDSWRVIVPLVIGVAGWALFHVHQSSSLCAEPSAPPRLFKHRTSATGFFIIFLGGVILQAINYFLPVYFQAVKRTSPLTSGVYFLAFALAIIPFGGMAGAFLSKTGLYIPLHWAGFAMSAIGVGLFSLLDADSSRAAWIGFQVIASGGTGIIFTATLPSTLAPLSEEDVSVATGMYSFVRSGGLVWGVTMASIVFNGIFNAHLGEITDTSVRAMLADGAAYGFAASDSDGTGGINSLTDFTRGEVTGVYIQALKVVWYVVAAVACLGFLVTFVEKHVELRKEHVTQFGLADEGTESSDATAAAEEGVGIPENCRA